MYLHSVSLELHVLYLFPVWLSLLGYAEQLQLAIKSNSLWMYQFPKYLWLAGHKSTWIKIDLILVLYCDIVCGHLLAKENANTTLNAAHPRSFQTPLKLSHLNHKL